MSAWIRWRSLRRWGRAAARVWRVIRSSQVPLRVKLLFLVPVLLYWMLPDVLPGPIDDMAVTLLLTGWFASYMEKKYPQL